MLLPSLDSFWSELYTSSQGHLIDHSDLAQTQLNNDLSRPAYVDTSASSWYPSPAKGVLRILLERDGGEKTTRATSLVAYQAGSRFSSHLHPKGEEFLVLAGTFSDERGDYPAGTYIRNPPGSSHSPFSQDGCLIFVKLQQFREDDSLLMAARISEDVISRSQSINSVTANKLEQVSTQVLFDDYEKVQLCRFAQDDQLPSEWFDRRVEILVLAGDLVAEEKTYAVGSWLRIPKRYNQAISCKKDTLLFIKMI